MNAKGLAVGYGEVTVVEDLDIHVQSGKITTIIGPNGSGKSTVLKALTRLLRYQRGSVRVDGKNLLSFGPKEFARLVGVLPQVHSAPPDFKVKDLVGYGRMPYQKWYEKNGGEDEKVVDWAMAVTGVSPLRDKSIHECSGGECQPVWIATVLAQQPEILFLDEPTTYLDISHQMETMRLIKRLNRESGIGVVMVLHDLS
ncbi:MAG TPA: ABC transporter ATP-binding protein, partial [Clostridia bacterium]|nr:ABC transporter ATP-binding protein [Clostridia bacterium]